MRTTLTIEDDVAVVLQRLRKTRDASLKDLVNEALRQGLKQMSVHPKKRRPFRTRTVTLGQCLIGSIDNIAEALARAEGESSK